MRVVLKQIFPLGAFTPLRGASTRSMIPTASGRRVRGVSFAELWLAGTSGGARILSGQTDGSIP